MHSEFTAAELRGGVWEGTLRAPESPSRVVLTLNGRTIGRAAVDPAGPGQWRIRAALPADTLSDGTQTYMLVADDGEGVEDPRPGAVRLGHLPLVAGVALDADLRAEIDLLRAELDLLKREFRRMATEQARTGAAVRRPTGEEPAHPAEREPAGAASGSDPGALR